MTRSLHVGLQTNVSPTERDVWLLGIFSQAMPNAERMEHCTACRTLVVVGEDCPNYGDGEEHAA